MRKYLTILFVCLLQNVFAQTTYYVSSSTGSDGNNGTSQATAWQTLSKVNSATFNPGDQILFKRGDIFVGRITVNQSGTAGNPITFGAYGTGANPLFNGFVSVTQWTNIGTNIWESTNSVSTLPTLKTVLVNEINTPMGATPNRDLSYPFLPNYFTFHSHTGDGHSASSLTTREIYGTNWTGADIVVRVTHWTLDKEPITNQIDSTIYYTGQTESDPLEDGWGFWIQNDSLTLDVQNEWYYNPSTHKIRLYSMSQPTDVKVATVDTMFYAHVKDYITIENIDFKGTNTSPIVFSACNNPTVLNCNIQYSGETALEAQNTSNNLKVDNTSFADIGGAGIWNTDGGANWILTNNRFLRMDLVSVIKPNDYTNAPIEIFSPGALVQYNSIDSTAYEGIHFRGNNVQIRNNFVNHVSILRDDGGGIYTGFKNETGKIVDGNIVLNAIGNSRGVGPGDAAGNGIYMDGLTVGTTITNNTVAHIVSAGIFLNNDSAMNVHNNTVYDIGGDYWTQGCLMVQTYPDAPYAGYQRNNSVTNNIFFQRRARQRDIFWYNSDNSNNDISVFGTLDSNWYAKAADATLVMYRSPTIDYGNYNLADWQTTSGKEVHGHYFNQLPDTNNIKLVYNASKNDSVVLLGAIYKDVKGVSYNNQITLQPYTSAILVYDSPSTPAPTVSMSGDQNITASTTSVFATGNSASGQIITGYQWTVTSGGSVTFGTPTASSTTVSGLAVGSHVLRCTVTQSDEQTAYGEVTINVTAANISPTANAGADQTIQLPTNSVSVTGSGTDSDGSISSYLWSKVSGGSVTITNPTSASTTFTGLTQGIYVFQLQVTDNNGAVGIDQITITVNAANISPVANAGSDQTITLPTNSVTLTGSGTDTDGSISGYSWSRVSGSGTITSPTSASTTVTGLTSTSVFRLTVTDNQGATGTDDVQVTVNAANVPPTANAGIDQTITLPTNSINVVGTGSDDDGTIVSYLWTKISGGTATIISSTSANTAITGLAVGTYTFQLQVTDNQGATGIDQVTITVNEGTAPTITLSGDQTITVNNASVSATVVWASGYSGSYQWTKVSGPGTTGFGNPTASSTTVTNLQTGTYVIQCQVTQDDGQTATAQLTLHVTIPLVITPSSQSINVKTKIKFINDKQ